MEPKNRLMIAAAVILIMVSAIITSFGRSLFALNTPSIELPGPGDASGAQSEVEAPAQDGLQPVEVTPKTVQKVIATLARPASYYRELLVETFWGEEGSSSVPVQVWADGGWYHSRQILPSGVIRHDLTGEEVLYYWYEGSRSYETAPAGPLSPDLAQRLPTYETVLELSREEITAASYEVFGERPCILVQVSLKEPERLERYWISLDSGLLVGAETEQEGQVVYRVTAAGDVQSPCPTGAFFQLPDGETLHEIS